MSRHPSPPEAQHVDIAGTTVSYLRGGNGPPLVWLHGLWGEAGWRRHLQALSDRFEVYKIHLPGYAGSQRPSWLTSVRDLAIFLLDALGLARPLVAGHCLGGWVGAELGMFRPQRLAKLVLVSPLGLLQDWTKAPNLFYVDPAQLPAYFFSDYAAHDAEAQYFIPKDLGTWDDKFLINREASASYAFDPYLHDPKLGFRLHQLTVPTLVIWGSQDAIVGVEHAQEWVRRIPAAETAIIPEVGHLPFVEQWESVHTRLVDFLGRTH